MPQSWLLSANKKEARPKNYQTFCTEKATDKWQVCFHSKHIQDSQYSIEYVCRILNTLYDEHIHLQQEIGVSDLDPSRPSLIEFLDYLSREKGNNKISDQLERFNLRLDQLEEINSRITKLEVKLDYLKEGRYISELEKKLARSENISKNIHQQAAELRETQENLKKLLETLVSRIG